MYNPPQAMVANTREDRIASVIPEDFPAMEDEVGSNGSPPLTTEEWAMGDTGCSGVESRVLL